MSLRFQLLSQKAIKSCAIALLVREISLSSSFLNIQQILVLKGFQSYVHIIKLFFGILDKRKLSTFQRNSKLQSLDLEGCQIRQSGAKYMFDVLEKRTNITEIVGYKFIARSECI